MENTNILSFSLDFANLRKIVRYELLTYPRLHRAG